MRTDLRAIFAEAMQRAQVATELALQVRCVDGELRVGELRYRLRDFDRVALVSIGKAAVPMCGYFAGILRGEIDCVGIAVGPVAEAELPVGIRYLRGGHPLPNESSFAAATAILEMLRGLDERALVLFLVSGGGSAMVELPIDPTVTLEEMRAFHLGLIHSGLSIVEMNALRKHVSAVKGGRLAVAAGAATQCTVLVSDVPEGSGDRVSSGPSLPDPSTLDDCAGLIAGMQGSVIDLLRSGVCPETPKPGDAAFARARWMTLLSNERLLEHAATAAERRGYAVTIDNACDDWDYAQAAAYLLERLRGLAEPRERVCLISGGELLVTIAGDAGEGGRNSHFALECALTMDGYFPDRGVAGLSAGSDGIDGNSAAAGAVVDGTTLARAREAGIDPAMALDEFNSAELFRVLGDDVVTGPTGNNLRDVRILLCG
jgi:glycerate 2-kinase